MDHRIKIKKPPPDPLYTLKGEMAPIYCLLYRLSVNAEFLYASTQDGNIHIWDLKSCRELNVISIGSEPCLSVNYLKGNFITQEKCGNIKIWLEVGQTWILQHTILSKYVGFCRVQVGSNCIICPEGESVATIRTINGEILENINIKMEEKSSNLMVLKYANILNNEYIFLLYECGLLALWKRQFGKISSLKITNDCPMTLDYDGNSRGIIGTSGSNLIEFNITDGFNISKGRDIPITNPGVSCVQIRPDKLIFVAGCWDGRIRFFSMKTLKLLAVLDHHQDSIQDVVFADTLVSSWKCKWLCAAASLDKKITLWNLYNQS